MKKFYESQRKADIECAKNILRQCKNHRADREYHADLMETLRLHMNAIRYFNRKLKAYD